MSAKKTWKIGEGNLGKVFCASDEGGAVYLTRQVEGNTSGSILIDRLILAEVADFLKERSGYELCWQEKVTGEIQPYKS